MPGPVFAPLAGSLTDESAQALLSGPMVASKARLGACPWLESHVFDATLGELSCPDISKCAWQLTGDSDSCRNASEPTDV